MALHLKTHQSLVVPIQTNNHKTCQEYNQEVHLNELTVLRVSINKCHLVQGCAAFLNQSGQCDSCFFLLVRLHGLASRGSCAKLLFVLLWRRLNFVSRRGEHLPDIQVHARVLNSDGNLKWTQKTSKSSSKRGQCGVVWFYSAARSLVHCHLGPLFSFAPEKSWLSDSEKAEGEVRKAHQGKCIVPVGTTFSKTCLFEHF